VMLALVDAGMDRQEAYKLLQRHTREALAGGPSLHEALREDPAVTSRLPVEFLDELVSPEPQLNSVIGIFNRLGLDDAPTEPVPARETSDDISPEPHSTPFR